jgi:hypothetical protein
MVAPAADFRLYPPEVVLAISDYLDILHRRMLDAERYGYQRGHAEGYASGFSAGTNAAMTYVKRLNGALVTSVRLEAARWGPRGRGGFGEPRPCDFTGVAS